MRFIKDHVQNEIGNVIYPGEQHRVFFNSRNWSDMPQLNTQISMGAIEALKTGYAIDNVRQALPFSSEYFDMKVNETEFYFWRFIKGDPVAGVVISDKQVENNRIVVGIHKCNKHRTFDLSTVMHEFGHILGLGHPLSEVFAETITNMQKPFHNFELCTNMDKVLMRLAGAIDFWKAAFWSNVEYGKLWDLHISHLVSYDTIRYARAGHSYVIRRNNDPLVHQTFKQATGLDNIRKVDHINISFESAFDETLPDSKRNEFAELAQHSITKIAQWAKEHGLKPISAVYDRRIPMTTTT